MKKIIILAILALILTIFFSSDLTKVLSYYTQITKDYPGSTLDLQPKDQKDAHYVGSDQCKNVMRKSTQSGTNRTIQR